MTDYRAKIEHLEKRMELLCKKHEAFSGEINILREEIQVLRKSEFAERQGQEIQSVTEYRSAGQPDYINQPLSSRITDLRNKNFSDPSSLGSESPGPKKTTITEKFIGENLINKIGIIITVIGVSIGAKYSIEHQLISPVTRIIIGYFLGSGLLGFGIKLRRNYRNYSAVLVSGAIAIMYFITYAACIYYTLIPQSVAFMMMVVFTVFGVAAAINYDNRVIALIGLVGAYAVPFMVGGNEENVTLLFSYIALINIGILIIAFKKYWKLLYYSSFVFTWLIFCIWFFPKYNASEHLGIALPFLLIYFITFYAVFLGYKLITKEKFAISDIVLLLLNCFIFYDLGYLSLRHHQAGEDLLGFFTIVNAVLHAVVAFTINRKGLADRSLYYFIAGLALVFITIAIPVQLNGNWVTLLWAGEAALLYWIGTSKNIKMYERLSYILIYLAFLSIIHDWIILYNQYNPGIKGTKLSPLWNINFLSSLLFAFCFGFINYMRSIRKNPASVFSDKDFNDFIQLTIPAIFLIAIYFSFRMEISLYWNQLFKDSSVEVIKNGYTDRYYNQDIPSYKFIWNLIYTLGFLSIVLLVNNRKIKNDLLAKSCLIFGVISLVILLTKGLYMLSELRQSYLKPELPDYYYYGPMHIGMRYIAFAVTIILFYAVYETKNQNFFLKYGINYPVLIDLIFSTALIWILSSEWINWLDIFHFTRSYKLGLSILWGISSLILIILGIWKRKRHLRIGAIVLFGITLVKLFFYDITHLGTIAKTIVFVSLGILLLIISFLYNRYRNIIFSKV